MRLGIFGGSFDPVHWGHLTLAGCCQQQAGLERVWWVPTAQQPLKPLGPQADDRHRLAMLQLACEPHEGWSPLPLELKRGGTSYTVDTLQTIRRQQPTAELFFLLGADALAELPRWHRPAEICRLATLLVVRRAGTPEPNFDGLRNVATPEIVARVHQHQIEMPPLPMSSSQIRRQIAHGEPWQDSVPPTVADYIQRHQLYFK